jgi:hypothetical protein
MVGLDITVAGARWPGHGGTGTPVAGAPVCLSVLLPLSLCLSLLLPLSLEV